MAKRRKSKRNGSSRCKRTKVCGNMRTICRNAKGQITSNRKA